MLRTRLLTAAILLPAVAALVLFAPPWLFTIVNAIAGLWGLYEVAAMTGALHWVAIPLFAVVGGVPLFALLYGGDLGWVGWLVPVIVILMMLGLVVRIEVAGGGERFRGPRLVFIGAAYVGFLFPYFALLRNQSQRHLHAAAGDPIGGSERQRRVLRRTVHGPDETRAERQPKQNG